MRKTTFLKSLLIVMSFVFVSTNLSAQLLVENFDYTVGTVLTATTTADPTTGWLAHSGNGSANIDVTDGLTFSGYAGSGIGGAANVDNTGQDINKVFATQNTGIVYVAFMLKTETPNSAGYFFMLSQAPVSSTFNSRIFINSSGDGIGLSSSSTAPTSYITITPSTTVLVVIKHDFTANTSDLFVLNSFSANEPGSAGQSISETYSATGAVVIRQYSASQRQIIDGIRVGNTWAEACAAPSSTPKVATPTFTAIPGNVTTTQTVGIETTTDGASIYYTTDGTDPNNTGNGTLYTAPISVSSTTTVKAIAYKASYDDSSIASATYTFPTEVANLAALRAANVSGFYKVTGEVYATFQSVAGKVKYIQDATAGIVVYDGSGIITTAYNFGDGITNILCTLSMYNGTLELIPFADPGAASSTGNSITPKSISIADLNTGNYQGQLVKISNVTFTPATGAFASRTLYTINDGTTDGNLRTAYTDLDYIGYNVPTAAMDITGVVSNYSTTEVDLVPRFMSDFSGGLTTGVVESRVNNNVYPVNGKLIVNTDNAQTVEIYNTVGQKLSSVRLTAGENTISVNARGLLLVKLGNTITKVIL